MRISRTLLTLAAMIAVCNCVYAEGLNQVNQLIAYYDFNGDAEDNTSNDYFLVPYFVDFVFDETTGIEGQSLLVYTNTSGGSPAWRPLDQTPKLKEATSQFSVTMWFRMHDIHSSIAPGTDQGLYMVGNTSLGEYHSRIVTRDNSNTVWGTVYGPGGSADGNAGGIGETLDTWAFMALVFDHGQVKGYSARIDADDLSMGSSFLPGEYTAIDPPGAGLNLYIGTRVNAHFSGQIDEVGIYNVALHADQVEQIFDRGKVGERLDQIVPDLVPAACGDPGTEYLNADLNEDCYVNWADFGVFAGQWLRCTDPANSDCDQYWGKWW